MAQFRLDSFIDLGTKGFHTATSWKVTLDRAGNNIIDQSLSDQVNLYHWTTPLPDGNGGFYADLNAVHLWVRVHILKDVSDWFYAGNMNQNNQTFNISQNGKLIDIVNSLVAGIN